MRSYTVTRVWGIPIRISISLVVFLPILAWLIGSGGQIELYAGTLEGLTGSDFPVSDLRVGALPWVIGVLAAVGLFVSVTLHELGHSWVALRYGHEIESITLWILGGIAALRSVPREWNREFWIAIAGPLTSIGVGAVCYVGVFLVPRLFPVIRFVIGYLAIVNVVLAVFNLLPAFPMDGGRILRALLARTRPYASATRIAGRIGVVFALLFAIVGVLGFNLLLLLLAFFVYGAATTESRTVLLDELLEGLTVGDLIRREPHTIEADASAQSFIDQMIRQRQSVYPVLGQAGDITGVVTMADLRKLRDSDREATRVADLVREVPRIPSTADAFDTLARLGQSNTTVALVEENGTVVGTLSEEDYAHALTIQRGFQSRLTG